MVKKQKISKYEQELRGDYVIGVGKENLLELNPMNKVNHYWLWTLMIQFIACDYILMKTNWICNPSEGQLESPCTIFLVFLWAWTYF